MDSIASLGIEIDSGPLSAASTALDHLEQSAVAAEHGAKAVQDAMTAAATSAATAGTAVQNTVTAITASGSALEQQARGSASASAAMNQQAAAATGLYGTLARLAQLQGDLAGINERQAAAQRGLYGNLGEIAALQAGTGGAPSVQTGQAAGVQATAAALTQQAAATTAVTAADREYISVSAQMAALAERLNLQFDAEYRLLQRRQEIGRAVAAGLIGESTAAAAAAKAEADYATQLQRTTELQRGAVGVATGAGAAGGLGSLFGGGTAGQRNFQITNASEQVRQFVEQVSYGTPILQAFSQQVPQALVGFGPWAAVLSIAAAAVGVTVTAIGGLIGSQQAAADAAKAQTEETDKLLKVLQVGGDTADKFAASLGHLTAGEKGQAIANIASQVELLTTQLNNAKVASDAATSSAQIKVQLGGPLSGGDTGFVSPEFEKASAQIKVLTDLYTSGWIKQDTYSAGLRAAAVAAGFTATQTQSLVDTQLHAANAVVELAHGLDLATAKQTLLVDPTNAAASAIVNQAEAINQAAQALGRYDVAGRQALAQQVAQQIRQQRPGVAGEQMATDYLTEQANEERRRQEQLQRQRDEAVLIAAGKSPAASQRIVSLAGSAADPSGRAGLEQKLNDLQAARAQGIKIEGDYNQRVADIKEQIAKLDDQAARTAKTRAEELARPAQELANYEATIQKAVDRAAQGLAATSRDPTAQTRAAGQLAVDQLSAPTQKQLESPLGAQYLETYAKATDAVRADAEAKKYDEQYTAAASDAEKAMNDERQRAVTLANQLLPPQESLNQQIQTLQGLLDGSTESQIRYNNAVQALIDRQPIVVRQAQERARQARIDADLASDNPVTGGLAAGAEQIVAQYGDVAKIIQGDLVSGFGDATDALTTLITTGKGGFAEMAISIEQATVKLFIQLAIAQALQAVFGAIGGGQTGTITTEGSVTPTTVQHFATGGSFQVGGSGGTDSQDVHFRASPWERVTVTNPGQDVGQASVINFNVQDKAGVDMRSGGARRNADGSFDIELFIEGKVNQAIARGRTDKALQGRFDTQKRLY